MLGAARASLLVERCKLDVVPRCRAPAPPNRDAIGTTRGVPLAVDAARPRASPTRPARRARRGAALAPPAAACAGGGVVLPASTKRPPRSSVPSARDTDLTPGCRCSCASPICPLRRRREGNLTASLARQLRRRWLAARFTRASHQTPFLTSSTDPSSWRSRAADRSQARLASRLAAAGRRGAGVDWKRRGPGAGSARAHPFEASCVHPSDAWPGTARARHGALRTHRQHRRGLDHGIQAPLRGRPTAAAAAGLRVSSRPEAGHTIAVRIQNLPATAASSTRPSAGGAERRGADRARGPGAPVERQTTPTLYADPGEPPPTSRRRGAAAADAAWRPRRRRQGRRQARLGVIKDH